MQHTATTLDFETLREQPFRRQPPTRPAGDDGNQRDGDRLALVPPAVRPRLTARTLRLLRADY